LLGGSENCGDRGRVTFEEIIGEGPSVQGGAGGGERRKDKTKRIPSTKLFS